MREREILFVGQLVDVAAYPTGRAFARVDTAEGALEYLRAGGPEPELIVLAQSRPGEFASLTIDALRRAVPLARFERVAGTWCEGEQRSGRPLAGCTNHYWHQWPVRFLRELGRARAGQCPDWGLPQTTTVDERLLKNTRSPLTRGSGTVVICARQAAAASALAEVCQLGGYTTQIVREDLDWQATGALAVVWDTTPERLADVEGVARIRRAADDVALVAVVGFPRRADVQLAQQAGVDAVVSKPYAIRDLLSELARVAVPTSVP